MFNPKTEFENERKKFNSKLNFTYEWKVRTDNKTYLLDQVNKYKKELGNYIKLYDDIINIQSMVKFKSYMRNYMKTAWTNIGYEECGIAIERSWINRFEKGSRLMGHAHGSTEMVMTYYHQVPEGSAEISFFNPFDRQLGMAPFKNKLFTYAPKAGDLLAWPGFLWHEVHVQQIDQPRIAISMHVHQGSYALADRWVRID